MKSNPRGPLKVFEFGPVRVNEKAKDGSDVFCQTETVFRQCVSGMPPHTRKESNADGRSLFPPAHLADQAAAMRSINFRVTFVLFSMAPSGRNSQWLWKLSPPVK